MDTVSSIDIDVKSGTLCGIVADTIGGSAAKESEDTYCFEETRCGWR
jgi:hypothetical protein